MNARHEPGVLRKDDEGVRGRDRIGRREVARDVVHAGLHERGAAGKRRVHERRHLVVEVLVGDGVGDPLLCPTAKTRTAIGRDRT